MSCPRCGSATRPGQKFCAECGLALAGVCPNCATPYEGNPKFCAECGHPLAAASAGAERLATAGQPASSPHVPAPSAERRLVTVLFADLVGFTQLSEQHDAEQTRELLSRYFETARRVIEGYGGTVEKFIGDAVMAIWGAPTAREDDAERSVRAALELVQAVGELRMEDHPLALRAGVLSGEAAVTPGRAGEGMVAGDVVNTASRLQAVAPPGTVLVGEQTRNQTSAAIAYEPAGEQLLKGKQAPVAAWRALRVVARVGGEGREEGLEPPFVGRQLELRLIKDQLQAVESERKLRVVSISGQAGMGKSRLAWELEKYLDGLAGQVYYWHQGRSPSYGEGVTFWALGEMVRRRARIAETEHEQSTRAKLQATLAEFVADPDERRRLEPALGALLGIADVDWDAREQLFSAWRTFFERIADKGPVVLVFEDLQWADGGLFDFIDHLLDWTRDRPMLIVGLGRPELFDRRPNFGVGRSAFVSLHLEPLSSEAMAELLRGLVPQLPGKDLQRIVARAEGVPLYAVEMVRSLVDGGHLVRSGDVYDLAGELPELEVPPGLRALIASRLDALSPADRSLLQDAAVVGLTFAVPVLAALAQRPEDEVQADLRRLAAKELVALETDPRSPERGQYRFRQELVREVAYGTLARRDRRARHLAAARYFEALGEDELVGVLANHYLEAYRSVPEGDEGAAVAAQARLALRAAAERASRLHSHEQALAYLEQAAAVTFDEADRTELLIQAAHSAWPAGNLPRAEELLRQAIAFYEARGDKLRAAATTAELAHPLLLESRIDEGIELVTRALAELPSEAPEIEIGLNGELARAYMFTDRPQEAFAAISRALEQAEKVGAPISQLLITKAWALSSLGHVRESLTLMRGILQVADEDGDDGARLRARYNLSSFLANEDPREALLVAEEGIAISRQLGNAITAANMSGNAASAALSIGDLDRVLELEAGVEDIRTVLSSAVHGQAAAALSLRGDSRGAEERMALLRKQSESSSSPQDVAALLFLEAFVLFGAGQLEEARRLARESASRYRSGSDAILGALLACQVDLLLADGEALEADLADMDGLRSHGTWLARVRRTLEAGRLALADTREEAAREFRVVIEEWRHEDLRLDLALALLTRAWLLGDTDAQAAAGLNEAHSLLAAMGAEGWLDRLAVGAGRSASDRPAVVAESVR